MPRAGECQHCQDIFGPWELKIGRSKKKIRDTCEECWEELNLGKIRVKNAGPGVGNSTGYRDDEVNYFPSS